MEAYTYKGISAGKYIEGEIEVNGEKLEKRDAIGIWDTVELEIKANTASKFLVMEIPMEQ